MGKSTLKYEYFKELIFMSLEKKSKRQERREKMQQQARRSRCWFLP
jgi:N-acetylglutamate synthase-like GNAT family acetyltransferase